MIEEIGRYQSLMGEELAERVRASICELAADAEAKEAANHQLSTLVRQLEAQLSASQLQAPDHSSEVCALRKQVQECEGQNVVLIS